MGSSTSKTSETTVVQKNEADINNPDPRSPTPEITRTPLQGKTSGRHNITKNVDLRKTFECAKGEEKLIHNNPILSAVIKNHLQSYDPRSPTQDFERTPIIIASNTDISSNNQKTRLDSENCASPKLPEDQNHNNDDICRENNNVSLDLMVPKNLCNRFYDMTLNDTLKENEEPLGSSTVSKEAIEDNISNTNTENKPTILLETNFDFIESDDKSDRSGQTVQSSNDFETAEDDIRNIPVFKILQYDPRSPSIGIDRTPIVVPKIEENSSSENVEEMSDDTLIKVLQTTNAELRQTITNAENTNTDGLLIYEDESSNLNDTPKKVKPPNNNNGSRTPLSCMKNKADVGHARSKSANTLFDPKNQKLAQSKIPKRISHIPRLKTLSKQTQLIPSGSSISLKNLSKTAISSGDCENTPPHSHRDRWDKDNSIVL